jgi:hypothetical protein
MPKLGHDCARRVQPEGFSGTICTMLSDRSEALPTLGGYDVELQPRRLSRASALLVGLAVICAAATVVFGIWMAGVVPAASIG